MDILINSIINKIQQNGSKEEILKFYDLYEPLVKIIYMDIEYIFKYKHGQNIAHNRFIKILNLDKYWGLLICPTGWGKSMMHLLFMSSYWDKYNNTILLLTKRKDILIDQMLSLKRKLKMLKYNGILRHDVNIINQINSLNIKTINSAKNYSLVVINLDKLNNTDKLKQINWDKIGFVICDEVHWFSGNMTHKTANYIKNKIKFCIGSSATPIRTDKDSQSNMMGLFGKPFTVLYELSYMEAWRHNVIVPIYHKYFVINDDLFDKVTKNGKTIYKYKQEGIDKIGQVIIEYINTKSLHKKTILILQIKKIAAEMVQIFHQIKIL